MSSLFLVLVFGALASAKLPQYSNDLLDGLGDFKIDIYRYENPVDRDHFVMITHNVGGDSDVPKGTKFEDYRFDGYITTVLSNLSIPYLREKGVPESDIKNYILSVYHGYHQDMKHNYFSKPWEPYYEGPVFFCARRQNYLNANKTLWTLDGQPIDSNGNLGYDTIYTTDLVERDLPNVEDYVMYRVLCYTWEKPEEGPSVMKAKPLKSVEMKANSIYERFTKLYQYFSEEDQDHSYSINFDRNNSKQVANFQNVIAVVIKNGKQVGIRDCDPKTQLVELMQGYIEKRKDYIVFLGTEMKEKIEKEEQTSIQNLVGLGFVAKNKGDGCGGRYEINIRLGGNTKLYNKDGSKRQGNDVLDQDVYLAPHNLKTDDPLYFNQTFYIW